MNDSISIRDFRADDAVAILEIQHTAGQAAQWQAADYERLSREPGGLILLAQLHDTGAAVGFLAARVMGEETELYNLAVIGTHRRRGVGKSLVQEFHQRLAAAGVLRVSCEVRAANGAALNLYCSFGYVRWGLRRNYYANNGEDALLLQCDLRVGAAQPV